MTEAISIPLLDVSVTYSSGQTFVLTISLICLAAVTIHTIGQIAAYLRRHSESVKETNPVPTQIIVPTTSNVENDLRLIAILSAAATAVVGKRVSIRRITFINQNTVSGWAEAGRQSIHSSHNFRR